MNVLDFPSTQSSHGIEETLQDIVRQVHFNSNFRIQHPDYQPFELPAEVAERFAKVPEEIRHRYQSLQLRSFIYGIYYNGSMKTSLALDAPQNQLQLDLENNTILGIDTGFFERLHESNQGEGYFDPDWLILQEKNDNNLVVQKGELKLHIERDRHLQGDAKSAIVGNLVPIKMPKNLMQNGFYMAVGDAGTQSLKAVDSLPETVRIYLNLTPEGAVSVMKSLTREFNNINLPFTFKVLYNPGDYERYDSAVFYFEKHQHKSVWSVFQTIYEENEAYFQPQIPLFTKLLAPGLGLAEEPDAKFGANESFGMNRCQIVANGLLDAWQRGDNSPEGRMEAIVQQFSLLGIDLDRAYLNAKSEDIYESLK
ncbi:MAG: T3SS effector HopA1 family protein [Cyanobacteriota bacterium]|nr:T3SS effector HopA1 family protein [Cyanobacteriota bacterium]